MGQEFYITREHAQFVLDRRRTALRDLRKTRLKYDHMGTLDYVGGGFGQLLDGSDRHEIIRQSGEDALKELEDLIDEQQKMYDEDKAAFDALLGKDWDNKQDIDKTQAGN